LSSITGKNPFRKLFIVIKLAAKPNRFLKPVRFPVLEKALQAKTIFIKM
jgi:hypothetical protein